ncbi:MAG: hypothetical protein AYP45_10605 [Candidatus Brocadia carolinensis]|uniref:Uncharacterized protein n=1 Tax=Candidatus Brocadia carolinensis TaxID=1004156 RepID=A0A1V4ASR1_9BACT|nr:MAG: hypothetical protein AYP45_10605 [Candidatus Brocadia caroliniensis]
MMPKGFVWLPVPGIQGYEGLAFHGIDYEVRADVHPKVKTKKAVKANKYKVFPAFLVFIPG